VFELLFQDSALLHYLAQMLPLSATELAAMEADTGKLSVNLLLLTV
jgi:hypothetical protein